MLVEEIITPTEFDRRGSKMKIPNFYKVKDFGRKTKIGIRTISIRDSKTGKVYGRRSIHTKI